MHRIYFISFLDKSYTIRYLQLCIVFLQFPLCVSLLGETKYSHPSISITSKEYMCPLFLVLKSLLAQEQKQITTAIKPYLIKFFIFILFLGFKIQLIAKR